MNARRSAPALLLGVVLLVGLAGCQTSGAPAAQRADASAGALWTTPRDWSEQPAGRLVRAPELAPIAPSASGLGVEAEVGFFSKYVWRGQLLTDDPVLQPAVSLTYGDWSFTTWANLELTDVNDDELAFTEVDLILEYAHTFDTDPGLTLLAGAAWYAFPASALKATAELYAGIGLDVPLQPQVTLYYDVAEVEGVYVQLSTRHDVPLAGGTLELGASLGWGDNRWNRFSWGQSGGGPNDLLLSVAWTYASGCWSFKPSVAYAWLVDEGIRRAAAYDGNWIFGLTAGLSF